MREGIHPQYQEVTSTAAAARSGRRGRPSKDMHLEICSNCHPFFTGRQKLVDTEGRVDRFTEVRNTDRRTAKDRCQSGEGLQGEDGEETVLTRRRVNFSTYAAAGLCAGRWFVPSLSFGSVRHRPPAARRLRPPARRRFRHVRQSLFALTHRDAAEVRDRRVRIACRRIAHEFNRVLQLVRDGRKQVIFGGAGY